MSKFECPDKFIKIAKQFHESMQASVKNNGEHSKPFPVTNGVKQGCVLVPAIFSIMFAAKLMARSMTVATCASVLMVRRRLKTKAKVKMVIVRDLLFADNCVVDALNESEMQRSINIFSSSSKNQELCENLPLQCLVKN